MQNSDFWIRITSFYVSQTSPVVLWMKNNVISIRITSLYWSQLSSVVFACKTATFGSELKVSMGPRLRLKFFAFKTATLVPELQVSMVPVLICGFCIQNSAFSNRITRLHGSHTSPVVLCMQYSVISPRITSIHGSQTSPVVLCMQTTWLASELLVSMGPNPHLWFLHAKQCLLDQNYKSLWVTDFACWFGMQNSELSPRMTLVYWSQALSVVLYL